MLSPLTWSANKSSVSAKFEFIESTSSFSIASIGLPAATIPTNGIVFVSASEDCEFSFMFLSRFCAFEVIVKERALPGDVESSPFVRRFSMCSNVVLRLVDVCVDSSAIVGE